MSPKDKVSQRTLNRALETLSQNHEGIITSLWKGIWERFEIEDYDINLDGSAVVLYGPKSNYGAVGYGRDKNRGKMQVEFMVAQLAELGIPIYIKPCKGNISDEEQFRGRAGPYRMVTSNWYPISRGIMRHILLHEGPNWGLRKVPKPTV